VVWNLKQPPEQVLRNEHRLGWQVVNRAAEQLASRFNSERIAHAIASAAWGELPALREALLRARKNAADALMASYLSQVLRREELVAEAKAMFAKTPSLDSIVDRAYDLLLESVGRHLVAVTEARA
jgi:stearoyl-CoA desaturase (delta-9 desaturase)